MFDVSIIIPCYNSGSFLPEAMASIKTYKGEHRLEIIIVDDGSSDSQTLELLNHLHEENVRVLRQENKGPAAARNLGVASAKSEFILFLDSDNKIRANIFLDTGLRVLKENPNIGVFYGNASFFGSGKSVRFESEPFDMLKLLDHNYIDMCSMIRKKVWEDVGELDENRLIIGHEDWDFWLRICKTHWKFYYTSQVLFDYRIRDNSLITQAGQKERYTKAYEYILSKNVDLLTVNYPKLYAKFSSLTVIHQANIKNPCRGFIKNVLWKFGLKNRFMSTNC